MLWPVALPLLLGGARPLGKQTSPICVMETPSEPPVCDWGGLQLRCPVTEADLEV